MLVDPRTRCPLCGLRLREILAARRAGCASCYRTFARELEPLRPRARTADEALQARGWRRWRDLRTRLDEAVLTENFERARQIKERLDRLRGSLA